MWLREGGDQFHLEEMRKDFRGDLIFEMAFERLVVFEHVEKQKKLSRR